MKRIVLFIGLAIFSIFIGCQIAEGALLVPHWESLSPNDFYAYYNEFGPSIGQFFTVLTIIAALIPIILTVYCVKIKSRATVLAAISTFLAILFVSSFYIYFKDANELFYQAALSEIELKAEFKTWKTWHWGRIVIEMLSLVFLILAMNKLETD